MIKTVRAGVLAALSGVSFLAMAAPSAHAAGMPQLDFHNPLVTGQVIWGGVIFLGFYLVLSRVMLPRVGRVLEDRSTRISNDLEVARAAKLDADNAVAELQQARRDALSEAQANLKQALDEEQRIAEQKMEEINARLGAEISDAEKRVAAEKLRAFAALKDIAAETTQSLVSRLTGAQADPALVAQKVEGATVYRTV
ncbi:MAG: F0F1 ATP synthase subunit B family protein [Acetobacter sp.]|uniref:F0F1 ATP synthase subunit B family protein n=1 Tax=Acetobacter sp. TaxID=440 RepID=UPI003F92219A